GMANAQDQTNVGLQPDGRIIVPTNQVLKPAGKQITFPGRPVSLLLIDDGKTLVVQNKSDLIFIDTAAGAIRQTLPSKGGLGVIGLAGDSRRLFVSDAKSQIRVADRRADGSYEWGKAIDLAAPAVGGAPHPAGLALRNQKELWAASTRGNSIQAIDL